MTVDRSSTIEPPSRAAWPSALATATGRHADSAGRPAGVELRSRRKKTIMTLEAGDKLMSLTHLSEMLGIPVHTLYRWRYKGDGPVGYRVGRHVRYRREAVEAWLEQQADKRQ
jgi:excisionase family DNA binding protein